MIKISQGRREAYVEVLEIIKHMNKKYKERLPKKLMEFFENNKATQYKFVLDRPIKEIKLKNETLNLLAMINLNYWCEDEEHKKQLLNKYHQNEIKVQEELLEKYNYDNLFKTQKSKVQIDNNINNEIILLVEHKQSFLRKIINIIKKAIYRKR